MTLSSEAWLWVGFGVLVLGALSVDLGLFQRKAHVVSPKQAAIWTTVWVLLALVFAGAVWKVKGETPAVQFITGYLVEYTLSVDNLFVFIVIFSYFGVPREYESRILMWGILGALVMRALFVLAGSALVSRFHWVLYVFGAILILTGIKLLVKKEEAADLGRNAVVRLFKRFFRATDALDGPRFFTRVDGRLAATPLFIVVLVVESSDIMFAVDSVPAIFSITQDTFVIYTSNVFAILGLRSLYFLLARLMNLFRFLKYGLVVILWFVGVKMFLPKDFLADWVSLAVIGAVLAISVAISLLFRETHRHGDPAPPPPAPPP